MSGLILKDFIAITKKIKTANRLIMLVAILVILVALKSLGALLLSIVLPLFAASFPLTLIGCDAEWKWDKYVISMPLTRKQIVIGRYLFCALSVCVCVVAAFLLNIGAFLLFHEYAISLHLIFLAAGFATGFIYSLLVIPASYIFGATGASFAMIILSLLIGGSAYLVNATNSMLTLPAEMQLVFLILIGIVFIIVLTAVSVFLSIKFYTKNHS